MRNRKRNLWICVLLLILNLAFIWGNSLLPADQSQNISDWILELLSIFSGRPEQSEESYLIRKTAHLAEFASLGLLLSWLSALLAGKWWYPLPMGVAVACIDETIQMFVPERGPALLDVGIDSFGVLMGMFLLNTAYFLMRKRKKVGG